MSDSATERVTVTLTGMAAGGDAVGRADGMVLFTAFGLPGETVAVEVTERKKNFARGQVSQVLVASPDRVEPLCRHFGLCGGCSWQHVSYAAQLRFKEEIVREQLVRIGKFTAPPVYACLASPEPWGYRHRARLAVDPAGRLGFRRRNSHDVIALDECPVLEPALAAQVVGRTVSRSVDEVELRADTGELEVAGEHYVAAPDAFFQVNRSVAGLLVEQVMAAAAVQPGQQVLDLYGGVGLFALPAARQGAVVWTIDNNPQATDDAEQNLAAFPTARVWTSTTAAALLDEELNGIPWDVVILDPPRTGIEKEALPVLAELGAARLVYVSCDPAVLARDARYLCDHGYLLVSAQPLDMFPQTHHIETVALFTRANG